MESINNRNESPVPKITNEEIAKSVGLTITNPENLELDIDNKYSLPKEGYLVMEEEFNAELQEKTKELYHELSLMRNNLDILNKKLRELEKSPALTGQDINDTNDKITLISKRIKDKIGVILAIKKEMKTDFDKKMERIILGN